MPIPPFIADLRTLVGHRLLWIASARAVVVNTEGHVLLGRYADTGAWGLPGGIIEPGEQPADAAVRECFEETGVIAVPKILTSVSVSQPETHPNSDQTQHLEVTFRCRAAGGEVSPRDGEFTDVRWHPLQALPYIDDATNDLSLITLALNSAGQTAFTFSGGTDLLPRRADGNIHPRTVAEHS
jgi:8-oxo-dGTP pyrophosphatase MutT (NUDIX family)